MEHFCGSVLCQEYTRVLQPRNRISMPQHAPPALLICLTRSASRYDACTPHAPLAAQSPAGLPALVSFHILHTTLIHNSIDRFGPRYGPQVSRTVLRQEPGTADSDEADCAGQPGESHRGQSCSTAGSDRAAGPQTDRKASTQVGQGPFDAGQGPCYRGGP